MADLNFEYLKIFFDGGSRNNPGPAAIGAVIYDKNNNLIDQISEFIGTNTNNIAEYTALEKALDLAKKYKTKYNIGRIIINTDSQLLYNQLRRVWRVKDKEISEIHKRITNKLKDYEIVDLRLIPRSENKDADKLVNRALDNFMIKKEGNNQLGQSLFLQFQNNEKLAVEKENSEKNIIVNGITFIKIKDLDN